ncbi:unnamed protein product [Rotaria sp. Silwood2]|nr:unnamed protein product [Rotaria sp. Silwood2]
MALTDQQLRQELISYGENVPPITQRNREQLRARLEILRSDPRTRTPASPSRSQVAASPSRSQAAASPSRTTRSTVAAASASPSRPQAAASPSRPQATASPSRATRATASPSRTTRAAASPSSLATSSPSRTRSSAITTTVASRPSTRSQQPSNLIELSDSETESSSTGVLMSRSLRTGQTTPNVQTRSIALRHQNDSPITIPLISDIPGSGNITDDVEQSIARHRREIKQLLDSARDRNRATNTSISSLHSTEHQEQIGTPIRPTSKSRTHREPLKDDDDDNGKVKGSPKSENNEQKKSPSFKHIRKPIQSFWGKKSDLIKSALKIVLVSSVIIVGASFLFQHYGEFFPQTKSVNCTVENVTTCEDMKRVIAAVRKQLQIRTGEVDCGFRPRTDILVTRAEIERYLNEKGLKFDLGNEERWNALVTYIVDMPLEDILVWNESNHETKNLDEAKKLSTPEAKRALTCRARQDISKTLRNFLLLILGSTGLLTLAWYLQKESKAHVENERTYNNLLEKATKLLEEQYEKHIQDPKTQSWVAINDIRERLISKEDQDRLKNIWERVKSEITKQTSRIRSETQETNGENFDVWRWLKSSPKKNKSESITNSNEEANTFVTSNVGLTECLKLRNCFRSDNYADDEEIDHAIESIRSRCANIKQIEHIGIHSVFVYLKFSSKEAAGQAYDLLNNWKYQDRTINVKYIRLNRYNEHFPDTRDASPKK